MKEEVERKQIIAELNEELKALEKSAELSTPHAIERLLIESRLSLRQREQEIEQYKKSVEDRSKRDNVNYGGICSFCGADIVNGQHPIPSDCIVLHGKVQ
jgi:RNA polymerase-binding transcription factor DksA